MVASCPPAAPSPKPTCRIIGSEYAGAGLLTPPRRLGRSARRPRGRAFTLGAPRSEAAALRWADVQDATDGRGVLVYIRRSKTDQDGTAADVRYLMNGCAVAPRPTPRPDRHAALRAAPGADRRELSTLLT